MNTIKEILSTTDHRPWPIPIGKWRYYQEWNDAVFLHWEVDLATLQAMVPPELEIDLFDGKPWISLVAFTMEKIRPRYLPSFSLISDFHEINIRTYVKKGNKSGVYFLSIEGGTRISCEVARVLSELPYRYSLIIRQSNLYQSDNEPNRDKLKIRYDVGQSRIEKSDLDIWLTERYALFQDTQSSINEFEIHHLEWPVYNVNILELDIDYPRFNKLMDRIPDRTHYSAGVKVIAWDKKKTKKSIL